MSPTNAKILRINKSRCLFWFALTHRILAAGAKAMMLQPDGFIWLSSGLALSDIVYSLMSIVATVVLAGSFIY